MIELILYVFVGLISGFITYWVSYKLCKEKLEKKHSENRYQPKPTHNAVKGKVLEEDMIPIVLSILAWPLALLVVYPVIGFVMGVCKLFNWIIDRVEGSKFK